MNREILPLLRCPFCTGEIRELAAMETSDERIHYGLLQCASCKFEYPVIAGVAIVMGPDESLDVKAETRASTVLGGPRVQDLVQLLKSGDRARVLSLLLGPASTNGNLFPDLQVRSNDRDAAFVPTEAHHDRVQPQTRFARGGRIGRLARNYYRRRTLPRAQLRLAEFLTARRDELSALDAIDLYYRQFSGVEMFNYLAFRFGQPRHLAALCLASLINQTTGPILDLACGAGHLTHFFTNAQPDRIVIGVDRDFFRLYLASQFVAPTGNYVCAPADLDLPFRTDAFGGIFSSDAFHLFLYRAATIRELKRLLIQDGMLILARIGNAEVEPREGYELSIDGYRSLLDGLPHLMMTEDKLIDRYLDRRGPDLKSEVALDGLRRSKWISVVASQTLETFDGERKFVNWPHGVGRLQINPIYVADKAQENGDIDLHFEFPSEWYEFENRRYLDYAPAHSRISHDVREKLRERSRTPAIDDLLDRFVILGLPERY